MKLHDAFGHLVAPTSDAIERALEEAAAAVYTADRMVSIFRNERELTVTNEWNGRSVTTYADCARREAVTDFLVRAALLNAERADAKEALRPHWWKTKNAPMPPRKKREEV
jgi:hypothetical protein